MYEAFFRRNKVPSTIYSFVSLLFDFFGFFFGYTLWDIFLLIALWLIYPVVESNGPLGVLLYLISQAQIWHMSVFKNVMEGRCANPQFFRYASLLFIVISYPLGEFVQVIPLCCLFFYWNKMKKTDTFAIISAKAFTHKDLTKGIDLS